MRVPMRSTNICYREALGRCAKVLLSRNFRVGSSVSMSKGCLRQRTNYRLRSCWTKAAIETYQLSDLTQGLGPLRLRSPARHRTLVLELGQENRLVKTCRQCRAPHLALHGHGIVLQRGLYLQRLTIRSPRPATVLQRGLYLQRLTIRSPRPTTML